MFPDRYITFHEWIRAFIACIKIICSIKFSKKKKRVIIIRIKHILEMNSWGVGGEM